MGDSFHPGGLRLTSRLADLLGVGTDSIGLDAGSGRGASAVHLARTLGCRVTGVTLEEQGVAAGRELAAREGVGDSVTLVRGDLRDLPLEGEGFDFALLECVLSILPDKDTALQHLHRLLKPGGRLGITDVTVSGLLPPELSGVLAAVGCVGGALSLGEYEELLNEAGFTVEQAQDRRDAARAFVRDMAGRLLAAEVASRLGKLQIEHGLLDEGKRLLSAVREQVERGVLGYGLLVARKPG